MGHLRFPLPLIEQFHKFYPRTIVNISWSNFVINIEVLNLAKITRIKAMLLKSQLHFAQSAGAVEYTDSIFAEE